ncbi:hypothetical protein AVEN_61330-1 [Araneus ventricosus]|uniref:Uncharacterized protein n=1 Tax=Araneus ventricosus TaxID=182803 RepID=A0A4Y2PXL4_ARAVE|nr:hypothetical protein AVEN_61330-1 [Araneus ventricosus]
MMRTTPELASTSPNFWTTTFSPVNRPYTLLGRLGRSGCCAPHQWKDIWSPTYDLIPTYTTHLQWNWVPNLEPSGPKVQTLPLGHSGLNNCFKSLTICMKLHLI